MTDQDRIRIWRYLAEEAFSQGFYTTAQKYENKVRTLEKKLQEAKK